MLTTADFTRSRKLVITVAITGGQHGKEANPNLPEQPDEQAQDAYDCYNAGASICHLHVRDKQGEPTADLNVYKEVITKIKAKCPILIQIGNAGATVTDEKGNRSCSPFEDRMKLFDIQPKPDLITINAGTFHINDIFFPNPYEFNTRFAKKANESKIPMECETYDIGHVANILRLADAGFLRKPLHFSLVLGSTGGIPARHEDLLRLVSDLPEGSFWQVIGIGKAHLPITIAGMCMGGNIRTGMEDTVYYRKGEKVRNNAQLVERIVKIARELGRDIATVEDTKAYWEIGD
jgi:3-keto-5-aminohexanoate cleavage enzyme